MASGQLDNLFFYLGSQSMSCKASLAALQLYGYFCDFCFVFVSENKYDDDDSGSWTDLWPHIHICKFVDKTYSTRTSDYCSMPCIKH